MLGPRPARAIAPDEADIPAQERAQWRSPRAVDDVPDGRALVDLGLDRFGQADLVLDDRAVRE